MRQSSFALNCTSFTLEQLKTLNLARGASGCVCSMIALGILWLLLYNKAYKSALQRMFLYLTSTTILLEALHAIQIERQFQYPGQEQFCSALGFLIQTSGGIFYMFTLEITLFLMYTVYRKLHRDPLEFISKSKKLQTLFEVLFLFGAIIISLSYHWIPFLNGNYGLAGAYCWIRGVDENCTNVGSNDQLAFYIVAEVIGAISILSMLTLAIVYCRIACKYKAVRSQQGKLVRHTLILMCFLTTHVLTLTVGLVARYITASTGSEDNYTLWFLNAAGIPVSLLVIPIGFLVYLYALRPHTACCNCRKICKPAICGACTIKCCERRDNGDEGTDRLDTNPSSHPIEYPSHTYWSTPYTDAFNTTSDLDNDHA